jgi:XTP/dITP diphosphohydrolase
VSGPFVLATANPDKTREIIQLLPSIRLLPRPESVPEVEETGETLTDNALLKARALVAATGQAAVADDTGLEVAALGGAPGVYSSRFAGEHASYADNVAKLMAAMRDVPAGRRQARFRTVAVAVWPDGRQEIAEGIVDGVIAASRRGDNGFGYDPVFVADDGDGRTLAEMTPEEKNAVSHRGRAFTLLAERLR